MTRDDGNSSKDIKTAITVASHVFKKVEEDTSVMMRNGKYKKTQTELTQMS